MTDPERAVEPQEEETPTDPPAAVQWMMQQAEAGQSAQAAPVPRSALWVAPAEGSTALALAAREGRVADALRGNDRLVEGLSGEAADALLGLGLDMGRLVVRDTTGLDDATAEDILQPRIRAVRRLMMAAARAAGAGEAAVRPSEWTEQAAIALGDRFKPPGELAAAAFGGAWRALHGRPADQIAALRRFIEDHTSNHTSDHTSDHTGREV
jgi:hypothetical protein